MKKIYLLPLLLGILLVTACEKDGNPFTPEPLEVRELFGQEYLNTIHVPPIMFQYAEYDHSNNRLSGFIINNRGQIRTYDLSEASYEYQQFGISMLTRQSLEKVSLYSRETGENADVDKVVEEYKKVLRSGVHSLEGKPLNADANITRTFYAYRYQPNGQASETDEEHNTCGSTPAPSTNTYAYAQITLLSVGKKQIINPKAGMSEIVEWLKTIPAFDDTATKD